MNFRELLLLSVLVVAMTTVGYSFIVPDGLQSAHTRVGEIQGALTNIMFDGTLYQTRTFLGIPYAKPPVGQLRFKKPEAMAQLPSSPMKALKAGAACPKFHELTSISEDCLFLNVYAPVATDFTGVVAGNAVMVWIYGGGFIVGQSDMYDGSALSAVNDVIVVTVNYRLGPLGFFSTHDDNAPGNYGLWDQQLAIQWVRDNIAAFGGDPDNISIFGESAGGSSVVYQTLYPGNKGLVKRAIAQSGSIAAWAVDRRDRNYQKSMEFATYVGCNNTDHAVTMVCLRRLSQQEMTKACKDFQTPLVVGAINDWAPVYDNDFVQEDTGVILNKLSEGSINTPYADVFHGIDLMIGVNNMDGSVYLSTWLNVMNKTTPLTGQYGFTNEQFIHDVMPLVAENVVNDKPTELALEAMAYEYIKWDDPNNGTSRLLSLIDMTTDYALNVPTILTANGHSSGSGSTYVYQFGTASPTSSSTAPAPIKTDRTAAHGEEIGFVFGFDFFKASVSFVYQPDKLTTDQMLVSKTIMTMWSNFAKTGNPNGPTDVQQFYQGVVWPEYDRNMGQYLQISPGMSSHSVKTKLAARAVQFWNEVLPRLQEWSVAN